MKKLLVDCSFYPFCYFPQLVLGIVVEEYYLYDYEEFDTTFFKTYYSFSEYGLCDFSSFGDLLDAFAKKFDYDCFEYI
ncbi:hypothetical protein A3835_04535 [Campylobacter concisus]|uniref:Uncharacterized protein n=1 Tax=Campylobacter concisus TaxID=199 RepID=A0A1X0U2K2_9BACT|nr:hypothetical protein A3835_04535 [Campylobacter concisus]